MPSTRSLLVTALVALLVAVSGCAILQGGSSDQATDISDRTQQSIEDVESYEFEMVVSTSFPGTDRAVNVTASGAADRADQRMYVETDALGTTVTQYVIGDTVYTNRGDDWVKRNVTAEDFWEQQPLGQQRRTLENSNVTFEGTDTIDGEGVYELSVDVSEEQLLELLPGQAQGLGERISLEDTEYTMYVSRDDHRLERITADTSMSVGGRNTDATLEMTFSNYDGDVTIELPPEAEDARAAPSATA